MYYIAGTFRYFTGIGPIMKYFFPALFQADSAPIHRSRGLTECFDEPENDVNQILWLS